MYRSSAISSRRCELVEMDQNIVKVDVDEGGGRESRERRQSRGKDYGRLFGDYKTDREKTWDRR